MASHAGPEPTDGVEFVYEDGLVTARDTETGIASCGDTKPEALAMLAEALALHERDEATVDDEAAVLRDLGLDPEEIRERREANDDLPQFLR